MPVIDFVGPPGCGKSTISDALVDDSSESMAIRTDAEICPQKLLLCRLTADLEAIVASFRYANTLGIDWRDGKAREILEMFLAQRRQSCLNKIPGLLLSQGTARCVWLSMRRHNASRPTWSAACGSLTWPDAVVIVKASRLVRQKRKNARPAKGGEDKESFLRRIFHKAESAIPADDALETLAAALSDCAVPYVWVDSDRTVLESTETILSFLKGEGLL